MNRIALLLVVIWTTLAALVFCVGLVPAPLLLLYIQLVGAIAVLYLILEGGYDWPTPVLVCLSATCLFLVVGDSVLRIVLAENLYFRPHERLFEKSPDYPESYRYKPNQSVTQRAIGDLANFTCGRRLVEERIVTFKTDAFGFRNDAHPIDRKYDVIVLGDSFGVANGTSQESTWWHLLAEQRKLALYNVSLPSAPRQEVSVLARELPRLHLRPQATVIWQLFEGNDLDDVPPPDSPDSKRSFVDRVSTNILNYQRRSPVFQLLGSLGSACPQATLVEAESVPGSGDMLFYSPYSTTDALLEHDIQKLPGWKFLQEAFAMMAQLQKQYGFRVLVVTIPDKSQIYRSQQPPEVLSPLASLIQKESERYGFQHLSVRKHFVLARMSSQEPLYWRDDTHLNNGGNALLASLVARALD